MMPKLIRTMKSRIIIKFAIYCSIILFFICVSAIATMAQLNQDSIHFRELVDIGYSNYKQQQYDSAFDSYKKAYDLAVEKDMLEYYTASSCLIDMGHCKYKQKKYQEAHQYYYAALKNARKYSHHAKLRTTAFQMLNSVHYLIQSYDLSFDYPLIKSSSEQQVYFDVDSVLYQNGDSAIISIKGGLYDGIIQSKNKNSAMFSVRDDKIKIEWDYVATITIDRITNNRCYATVKLKNNVLLNARYQVRLLANTSSQVANSGISDCYLYNFIWISKEKYYNVFNRRFLYYYSDDDYGKELMDLFKNEIKFVIDNFGADTLNEKSQLSVKVNEGIFTGKNPIKALEESNGTTINFFLRYMLDNYTTYSGQPFHFSEIYATWVLNKAPLFKNDIGSFILGEEKKSSEMIARAKLVKNQVETLNLTDEWIDNCLQSIDKSYWGSLLSKSRLLYHYGKAVDKKIFMGWSNFMDAVRLRSNGYADKSEAYFSDAKNNFMAAGSAEGLQWIDAVKQSVFDSTLVQVQVQQQHALNYELFASPNQRYFITAGKDFTIKVWDINLGKQIRTIQAHNDEVTWVAYNPGGRYFASLSLDSTIKVWNTFNYQLMNTIALKSEQRRIKYTLDGKYIVSAGYDSLVSFWEPFTGKLVKQFRAPGGYVRDFDFYPKNPNVMYLVCSDSSVYAYQLDVQKANREINAKQSVLNFFFSTKGKYACYTKTDSTITVIDMTKGTLEYAYKIFTWQSTDSRYFSDAAFSPDEKYLIFCSEDSATYIVDLNQGKSVPFYSSPVSKYTFNADGKFYIKYHFSNPAIVDFSAFDFNAAYTAFYSKKGEMSRDIYYSLKEKEYDVSASAVFETRFSKDDKKLFYSSVGSHRLDFTTGKVNMIHPEHSWMAGVRDYPTNEENIAYVKFKVIDTFFVYNAQKQINISAMYLAKGKAIRTFSFFDNDTKCWIGGKNGELACWDVVTNRKIIAVDTITIGKGTVKLIVQIPGTKKMLVLKHLQKPFVMNAETGEILDSINIANADLAVAGEKNLLISNSTASLFIVDVNTLSIKPVKAVKFRRNYLSGLALSQTGKYVYVLDEPSCYTIDVYKDSLINAFVVPEKYLSGLSVSHSDSIVVVSSMNSSMYLFNPFSNTTVARIYLPSFDESILIDNEGHYMASKKALNTVVFSQGYKYYNFDQFDIQLNQPHKVLTAIGAADEVVVKAYENAYLKRLKRNNINNTNLVFSPSKSPSIIILNRSAIQPTTNEGKARFRVECYDNRYKLKSLKIFVNDVPVIDTANQWSLLDTTSQIFDIEIPLTFGDNKVKMYCLNTLGNASYRETFDIYCTAKNLDQQVWFIGLGVSNYKDPKNNLTYTIKDIRDLVKAFKTIYPNLIVDTLMNKDVTLTQINALKERMHKIKVTDRVIMAVTGHGLLSDSLDFYYATYDVDFDKPQLKGLKYEDLEDLLNHTAARQKLLLIDACHSGLVDKEASSEIHTTSANLQQRLDKNVKAKGARKLAITTSAGQSATNVFNLMQNSFADFSNDNGIVVISAAGGTEYAFESNQWKNGVFTYCVLKGLKEKEADEKSSLGYTDGKITVQELLKYVSTKVAELTRGKQRPTSRRENLDFDWVIR